MNDEEDLSEDERRIRHLLLTASTDPMPGDVFAHISQALSAEVQLRHEDPDRDAPETRHRPAAANTPSPAVLRTPDQVSEPGLVDRDADHLRTDDLDDCGSLD